MRRASSTQNRACDVARSKRLSDAVWTSTAVRYRSSQYVLTSPSGRRSSGCQGAARALAHRYGAPLDGVQADVTRFATRLEAEGLLVRAATADGPQWPNGDEPASRPWEAPVVEAHEDMAHLVLRDPTLLVDEAGWPHLPEPAR